MNVEEAIKVIIDMGEYEHFVDEPISKKSVLSIINQIDEPKRVVIPKFVADWIEECKAKNYGIGECLTNAIEYAMPEEVIAWFDSDKETEKDKELLIARAYLDGYEIEPERLYTVRIPNPNHDGITVLEKVADYIILNQMEDYTKYWVKEPEFHLTENEIKKDFEWAWRWAKEVEG
ncbi:DUF1642 domain-containing protein [Streptococcus sp. E17BB]|uniref:DUF1642 domain-containing protein n=1 Tax=Streptococcus sp. E17BB TaxID=3278714 RepID=UPI00359F0A3A